ncbi:MAG: DUF3795 domain-containing protein [Deltaproteobacteria bacterium]|nr:DUF3795 domain-containing protein [Deltaproteobacteria bacterium]
MNDEKILNALAPCGLNCEKCYAHVDGEIRQYSRKLKNKLGNFAAYAEQFATLLDDPIFKKYPDFQAMLDYLAGENCKGCRKENCKLFKNCGVRSCHQGKDVDFCFQCNEFPCDKTNFDVNLQKRWVAINERIRQIGIEKYYAETRDKPRY